MTNANTVALIGPCGDGQTLLIHQFLERNGCAHVAFDTNQDATAKLIRDTMGDHLPMVVIDGETLVAPDTATIADRLSMNRLALKVDTFDVLVVGGGPAGLSAAVYLAAEGLSVCVVEEFAPGGQASTSSMIENYLGFPDGLSGQHLADLARAQAKKFGVAFHIGDAAAGLDCSSYPMSVHLKTGGRLEGRAVVIATGAHYRKLGVERFDEFCARGVYWSATAVEAELCRGEEVVVVGGANSAGQAAVFLAEGAQRVHLVVRGPELASTMSSYLRERIELTDKIEVHFDAEVTELAGDGHLGTVGWTHKDGGYGCAGTRHLFCMIGADPSTEWLDGCCDLDDRGFVKGGFGGVRQATSRAGVFVIGDVRSGSVKRVAAGVGEGAVVSSAVYEFLHPHR